MGIAPALWQDLNWFNAIIINLSFAALAVHWHIKRPDRLKLLFALGWLLLLAHRVAVTYANQLLPAREQLTDPSLAPDTYNAAYMLHNLFMQSVALPLFLVALPFFILVRRRLLQLHSGK